MNSIKGFNPSRFFLLIRNQLFLDRSIFYFLISAGAILILFSIFEIMSKVHGMTYQPYYRFFLFIGGISLTGRIFKGLHDEVKGSAWLTLPASIFEKFMSRLILLTVIYPLALMAVIFLISLISAGLHVALIGSSHGIFNPFDKSVLLGTAGYIVLQSPFFLGAIYFKKNPLAQTILAIAGYSILLVLIAHVFSMIIYPQNPGNFNYVPNMGEMIMWITGIITHDYRPSYSIIYWVQLIFFWCVIAPACWVTGYFRLKEKEL